LSPLDLPQSHIAPLQNSDPRVTVGRFTYGTPHIAMFASDERVNIGSFCSIASHVTIFGGGEHRTDWISTFPMRIAFGLEGQHQDGHPASKGPTTIGHDVWLGTGCMILSGVTVGHGAVIGAGAVVTSNVAPYAIAAGNPSRTIRHRLKQADIDALLGIQWWDWPLEAIRDAAALLSSNDILGLKQFALKLPITR
jgi:acetyltransferase-like isoleucine patch superfamily enzyme